MSQISLLLCDKSAMQWLRLLIFAFQRRGSGSIPGKSIRNFWWRMALGQVFLRVQQFLLVTINPSFLLVTIFHQCFVVTFKSSTILAVVSTIKFNTSVCLYTQNCDRNHLAGFEWFCFGVVSRRIPVILNPERHSFVTAHVPSLKSVPSRDAKICRRQGRLFVTLKLLAVFYTVSL
jgi:hypothetical protein